MKQPQIQLTDSAAEKIFSLIQGEGDLSLKLRISIAGGGCSGFQYHFAFENQAMDDDISVSKPADNDHEVTLLVDPISFQYLSGATVDYRVDGNGQQFVIKNPHAETTCGCGSSFSLKE